MLHPTYRDKLVVFEQIRNLDVSTYEAVEFEPNAALSKNYGERKLDNLSGGLGGVDRTWSATIGILDHGGYSPPLAPNLPGALCLTACPAETVALMGVGLLP